MLCSRKQSKTNRRHSPVCTATPAGFFIGDTMKLIALTQGKYAIVDDEDFEWLNQWKWCADNHQFTFYAVRTSEKTKIYMHSFIIKAKDGYEIDHRNNNGLDNQRHNLRVCTHIQNCHNGTSHKDSTSNYKGVSWYKNYQNWNAKICHNYKIKNLGYYESEIEAAKAYDEKAKELFGEFAKLNNA